MKFSQGQTSFHLEVIVIMKIKSAIAAFVSSALLFGSSAAFANTEITVQCWDQYFNVRLSILMSPLRSKMWLKTTLSSA